MLKRLTLFLLLFLSTSGFAQQMTIKGTVVDTNAQYIVRDALVMAVRVRDSVLVTFQRTDKTGSFSMTMPVDTVKVTVSHPKYGDYVSYFFGSAENNLFEIDKLVLSERSTGLGEVVIYANRNPIYYRGDTLVYVADSFKVKENAVVEDLIKRLPGMSIDADGKITSQGKEINQVLVDGDEFFGSDPTIATKNLAASGVDQVQVYEKDSEDGSDEKIQVLDLKLKEEAKKGYFGKVSGAAGLNDFIAGHNNYYEGELLLNRYNSRQKIAVFALGSNTPKSDFGWQDQNKFGLSSGNRWEESDDGMSWDGGDEGSNGVPRTLRAGFYLDQKLWKGGEVRLNYSYSNNHTVAIGDNHSQYFLTDTSYITDQHSRDTTNYQTNSIGVKFKQQLDSTSRLEIEPKLNLTHNTQLSRTLTEFRASDSTLTRITDVANSATADGLDFNTTARYFKDFKKKNREMKARYNIAISDNKSIGYLNSLDTTAAGVTNPGQTYNQKKDNSSANMSHTAYINFIEPIAKTKKWKSEFEYEMYMNDREQRKYTFNAITGEEYTVLDSTFSNSFQTSRQQHRVGAFLIYENAKSRISVGSRVRNIGIDNYNVLSDTNIRQDLNNLLPRVVLTHKFTNSNRLRLQYNTNSSLPSVDQLQPVQDNSNPNFVRIGNPDLKPNYTHTLNLNYNMWKGLSGFYVYSGMSYTYQKNAFSTSTTYRPGSFVTQSMAINVDRADFVYFWGGTGMPIPKVKDMRANINVNGNFTSTENMIELQLNKTKNTGLGTDIDISYNGDTLAFSVGGGIDYNIPKNTLNSASSQPYTNYNLFANVDWTLPFHLQVKSDITYTVNSQLTAGYARNYVIWNASLMRKFLKTENLQVGVEAYDILNQNISVSRSVTANVITDNRTNIITRFFLAKVVLRFNNNHIKEEDEEHWF